MSRSKNSLLKDLRGLIEAQAVQLGVEARSRRGRIPPHQVERLESLEKLAGLLARREPNLKRRRLLLSAVLIVTAACTSWLLFGRKAYTTVLAEMRLSETGFELVGERSLLDREVSVSEISVSGLSHIEMPAGTQYPAPSPPSLGHRPSALAIEVREGGRLSLGGLTPGAGARVTVSNISTRPSRFRIAFKGPAASLRLAVAGPMRLDRSKEVVFSYPQVILLETDSATETMVDLTLRLDETLELASHLPVRNLALYRVHEEGNGLGARATAESTILGGNLILEEINSSERRLRLGEPLTFQRSEGVIQALRLKEGEWLLDFEGRVCGMETGFRERRRSLMPTHGQWLRAQDGGAWLFWGAAFYLVGLAYGVLTWLGIEI